MPALSRRDFLKFASRGLLVAGGVVGLGMLTRFFAFQAEPPAPGEFDLGPAADYPLGTRTLIPEIPALLIHTGAGFSALSLVCTHLGCTLEQVPAGFTCPCHGSRFDPQGGVSQGPAEKPLASLPVVIDESGHVIVYSE